MREIKFRAWDISKRKILRNVGFHPHICMIHEGYKTGDDAELTIAPDFTNYKIMQYTGLKDRNGVEIYEGDILGNGLDRWLGEVIWRTHGGVGFWVEGGLYFQPLGATSEFSGLSAFFEVIGNIHQNPGLLENDDE